jgi:hypothetical protein
VAVLVGVWRQCARRGWWSCALAAECLPIAAALVWHCWATGPHMMDCPRITETRGFFWMTCAVAVNIQADAHAVWRLLTDAQGFPRWNSTVTSIEGEIRDGARLRLRVPGSERVFTPVVSEVVPGARMTWTGGVAGVFKGVRVFTLTPRRDGSTDFTMEEWFSGVMLPIVSRWLPVFGVIFEQYAHDLKRESERSALASAPIRDHGDRRLA